MEHQTMNTIQLSQTVIALLAEQKGLLAIDENISTCNERFTKI
ncbi:hypothetical protein [Pedobacter sp. SL55]|nr:hypothetical protein [Pedobacter sp. SL55]WAC39388.1 hypothetical protein OVA16_12335 [Pedobacter sp. SL55]